MKKELDSYKISIDSDTLRIIERSIDAKKYDFSDDELVQLYKNAKIFYEKNGKYMEFADKTRYEVEHILDAIRELTGGNDGDNR